MENGSKKGYNADGSAKPINDAGPCNVPQTGNHATGGKKLSPKQGNANQSAKPGR